MIFEYAGSNASNKPVLEKSALPHDDALRLILKESPSFGRLLRMKYNALDTRSALFRTNRLARQMVLEQWKNEIEKVKFLGQGADAPSYRNAYDLEMWKWKLLERMDQLLSGLLGKIYVEKTWEEEDAEYLLFACDFDAKWELEHPKA